MSCSTKRYKKIKDLTQSEIIDICKRTNNCGQCPLRKACCLTADLYKLIQDYKKSGKIDYELERMVYVWTNKA